MILFFTKPYDRVKQTKIEFIIYMNIFLGHWSSVHGNVKIAPSGTQSMNFRLWGKYIH